jgi:hypothetical protein
VPLKNSIIDIDNLLMNSTRAMAAGKMEVIVVVAIRKRGEKSF